jgi:hypothetical protein
LQNDQHYYTLYQYEVRWVIFTSANREVPKTFNMK